MEHSGDNAAHNAIVETVVLDEDQLKKLQGVLLEILSDIDDVCRKNNISYSLCGGTLLGAVRDNSFIPWDDDCDIVMTQQNFNKFKSLWAKEMHCKYDLLVAGETAGYPRRINQLRMKGTSVITREDFMTEKCGAFVDIFIAENVPDNAVLRKIHGTAVNLLGGMAACRKCFRSRKYLRQLTCEEDGRKKSDKLRIMLGAILSVLPMSFYVKLCVRVEKMCGNNSSKYVTIPGGKKHYFGEMLPREVLNFSGSIMFCGKKFMCPQDSEKYLLNVYGDWKTVPEGADRVQHVFFAPFVIDRS